ncbi:MAG: type I pullulanase [Eubacterium sp.]|nr:type I pullulanase [Eubacterium sp.]
MKKTPLLWKKFYKENKNRSDFNYNGPLGAVVTEKGTIFRLWSPVAEAVRINLYDNGGKGSLRMGENGCFTQDYSADNNDGLVMSFPMEYDRGNGVWFYESSDNLAGAYYDFDITIEGVARKTADPYAVAAGVNGLRSMILPREVSNPEGWKEDKAPAKPETDIIYEINIREFSHNLEMGDDSGKYTAFKRMSSGEEFKIKGTEHKINPLKYLKELGVTHVQLLPSFDFGSVDERKSDESFNWGYDPVNYNIPEGSFSTNPSSGETRVLEYKEMVEALHKAGFRVIMDVVYNHTYTLESSLQKTVPWYYYRVNNDGTASNGSHCGNDIASERYMAGRYIINSVLYWAEEYHIDGFRFDLMGLLDTDLMNGIREALDERFGKGEKLLYGEPWAADETAIEEGFTQALKANTMRTTGFGNVLGIKPLDGSIGFFNDDLRDLIKGIYCDEKSRGFVNGGCMDQKIIDARNAALMETGKLKAEDIKKIPRLEDRVARGITAFNDCGLTPMQMIRYVSSHDDHTLWDKLTITTKDESLRRKQNMLAAAVYILGQGHVFMLSGEEFLRTKNGESNSYNLPISLNALDWKRAFENSDIVDFYKNLIAIRKNNSALSDMTSGADGRIRIDKAEDGMVAFEADDIFVVFNSNEMNSYVSIPQGRWEMILGNHDDRVSGEEYNERVRKVDPVSVTIYRKCSGEYDYNPTEMYKDTPIGG